ncbi:MAG TPA: DoxX family protein [Chryseosolibacter sp.]
MRTKIFATDTNDFTTLILRVTLAVVIFPHGLQKLLGAFGGYGFEGTMSYFTDTVGLPWILGFIVIIIESFGMLLLAVGLFTRPISLILAVIMLGAASMHLQNGFFMNWFNNQPAEGVEFFILTIALSLNGLIKGAGKYSVDATFLRRNNAPNTFAPNT